MYLEVLPDGSAIERYDIGDCCGLPLDRPGVLRGYLRCTCADTDHRTFLCPICRTLSYDPPHDQTRPVEIGTGYYFQR